MGPAYPRGGVESWGMVHLLVVDDAFHQVRIGLDAVLEGYRVSGAVDGASALKLLRKEQDIQAVLLDVRMPPTVGDNEAEEGLAVFSEIRELRPHLPVIFLSAYDDLSLVNQALTKGGFWYLKKPPDMEETKCVIRRAIQFGQERLASMEQKAALEARIYAAGSHSIKRGQNVRMVGKSAPMDRLTKELSAFAATSVPVLLLGETGTGKELCAREIHESSSRSNRPFVAVNGLELNNQEVALARLFGHAKGAFTGADKEKMGAFEQANGGTLFLDEVLEIDLEMQGRLLRVLQEREVVRIGAGETPRSIDVRLVFATNRDPATLIAEGVLREDFYHRIAVGMVQVPPLRERLEDLKELAEFLLNRAVKEENLPTSSLSDEVIEHLKAHNWAGNVRELDNVLKSAAIRANGSPLDPKDFSFSPAPQGGNGSSAPLDLFEELRHGDGPFVGLKAFRDEYGNAMLRDVLSRGIRLTGSVVEAGKLLGFVREENRFKDYENLRSWMKTLGLKKRELLGGAQ